MSELADELLAALTAVAGRRAEVYLKQGRTRRYRVGAQGAEVVLSEERGWAVRAGGDRSSFFAAGSGRPAPDGAICHGLHSTTCSTWSSTCSPRRC